MELGDSGTESLKLMIIQLIQNQKLNYIRDRDMNGHVDKSHMSGCQSNEKLMFCLCWSPACEHSSRYCSTLIWKIALLQSHDLLWSWLRQCKTNWVAGRTIQAHFCRLGRSFVDVNKKQTTLLIHHIRCFFIDQWVTSLQWLNLFSSREILMVLL